MPRKINDGVYQREERRKTKEKREKQEMAEERQSGRSKERWTNLSGQLFLGVGRERASHRRLVERDVCL